jgi:SHS2 domain-containing protein
MNSGFRVLEHPADIGIEAHGPTLADAFEAAAAGLLSLIVDPATVGAAVTKQITLAGDDDGHLLVRWLSELLFLFDGEHFVTHEARVHSLTGHDLQATVTGELLDPTRHALRMDVKAVTYHRLSIEHAGGSSSLRVFFDI